MNDSLAELEKIAIDRLKRSLEEDYSEQWIKRGDIMRQMPAMLCENFKDCDNQDCKYHRNTHTEHRSCKQLCVDKNGNAYRCFPVT